MIMLFCHFYAGIIAVTALVTVDCKRTANLDDKAILKKYCLFKLKIRKENIIKIYRTCILQFLIRDSFYHRVKFQKMLN